MDDIPMENGNTQQILYRCEGCSELYTIIEEAQICCQEFANDDDDDDDEEEDDDEEDKDAEYEEEEEEEEPVIPNLKYRDNEEEDPDYIPEELAEEQSPTHGNSSFVSERFVELMPATVPTKTKYKTPQKSPHQGPGRYDLWCNDTTGLLINLVKENYSRLAGNSSGERGYKVWKEIKDQMSDVMPDVTQVQVQRKWKNLKLLFSKYEARPDGSKIREPAGYEMLKSFLEVDSGVKNVVECGIEELLGLTKEDAEPLPIPPNFSLTQRDKTGDNQGQKGFSKEQQEQTDHDGEEENTEEGKANKRGAKDSAPPAKKRKLCTLDSEESRATLQEILEETRRHNLEVEEQNLRLREMFTKIAGAMEKKNKLLRTMVEREFERDYVSEDEYAIDE